MLLSLSICYSYYQASVGREDFVFADSSVTIFLQGGSCIVNNVWLVIDEINGFSCQSASYAAISNNNNNITGAINKQFIIKFDAMHHMLTDLW